MFKRKKYKNYYKSPFKLNRRQKRVVSEGRSIRNAIDSKPNKFAAFVKAGGGKSGVYDISNKQTAAFVKKYREFIPKNEIYKRRKDGSLAPVYRGRKH